MQISPINPVFDGFGAALSGNWTTPAGPAANTGAATTSGGQVLGAVANTDALCTGLGVFADGEAFMTIPVLPAAGNDFRLLVRSSPGDLGATECYMLRVIPSTTTWDIRKRVAGTLTTIFTTSAQAFAAGDKARLVVQGSDLIASIFTAGSGKWTQVLAGSDTAVTAPGYLGLAFSDNTQTVRGDDWGGGNAFPVQTYDLSDLPPAASRKKGGYGA